jgi:Na+/proline symporter
MTIALIDWAIIAFFLTLAIGIGIYAGKRASASSSEFFLSGRSMPWWLLGMSMVATTFSTDTPNLVADITRTQGVAGNWVWWSFLLTGMLTTFVFARLWRRSNINTDIEFYEVRYSGKPAAFLRGFRAIYLGVFFNIMVMATVTLAAIKFGSVLLGLSPITTVLLAGGVTVIFSTIGGFLGVLLTDFILFIVSMVGSAGAAYIAVTHPKVGGLTQLLNHPNVVDKISFLPDMSDPAQYVPLLVVPLAVQWWSVWYPGSEPGGGGYIAQRMLAAKSERHALGAVMFFNFAHYALRPWPWVLVALASLVVFPDLLSLQQAFPNVEQVGHDMAYPAMLTFLPTGLMGLVVASLIAAYMSTMSTSLNLGASYIVNDFYKRFVNQQASDKQCVTMGRVMTVLLMIASSLMALALTNAMEAFQILLSIGAGTGLLFILRWFWWRINAWAEITAMVVSFVVSLGFFVDSKYGSPIANSVLSPFVNIDPATGPLDWHKLVATVAITTSCWIAAAFLTTKTDSSTLKAFYQLVKPVGPGWKKIDSQLTELQRQDVASENADHASLGTQILCAFFGCIGIYAALFAIGAFLYGNPMLAAVLTTLVVISMVILKLNWRKVAMT